MTLARKTAKHYASLYDLHIEPYLGELNLTELTPEAIGRWQADRIAAGAGRVAVLHGDATLISVLAYAGLRPQEALALQWGDVRERTLLIQRAVSLGEEKDTKTTAHRNVRLLTPLREDLLAWKLRSGRPHDEALVFPGPEGGLWTKTTYDNWRGRAFDRARIAATAEKTTPYALRHSFASLLLHEGRSVVYVARQLGHDARLTLTTYGHVTTNWTISRVCPPRTPSVRPATPRVSLVCPARRRAAMPANGTKPAIGAVAPNTG